MDYNPQIKFELAELPHNLYWQIPVDGAAYLKQTVVRLKPTNVLEIGTSSGYSALYIAEGFIEASLLNSKLYTIESHQGRFQFASENIAKAGATNYVIQIKGHAPEAIPLNTTFDLAFFDGTKNQTSSFFDSVWPILSPGGEILVDNVISHQNKMQPFFDHLKTLQIAYEVLELGAGICRVKKVTNLVDKI